MKQNESIILLREFNAHVGTNEAMRKGRIGKHGGIDFNANGKYLLQLCCNNGLCQVPTTCTDGLHEARKNFCCGDPDDLKKDTLLTKLCLDLLPGLPFLAYLQDLWLFSRTPS